MEDKLLRLEDMTIKKNLIEAVVRGTVPPTMHTNETYALFIYLEDRETPLTQVYEDIEDRDAEYQKVKEVM